MMMKISNKHDNDHDTIITTTKTTVTRRHVDNNDVGDKRYDALTTTDNKMKIIINNNVQDGKQISTRKMKKKTNIDNEDENKYQQ